MIPTYRLGTYVISHPGQLSLLPSVGWQQAKVRSSCVADGK